MRGVDRDRLRDSCWRTIEGWLEPPRVADGEDEVVAWLVEPVPRSRSAMIEDVPFGRVQPLRPRGAREIKAAIGATVRTALISPTTILVYSVLAIDAKTEDQQRQDLRDAPTAGQRPGPATRPTDWRRRWSQTVSASGK